MWFSSSNHPFLFSLFYCQGALLRYIDCNPTRLFLRLRRNQKIGLRSRKKEPIFDIKIIDSTFAAFSGKNIRFSWKLVGKIAEKHRKYLQVSWESLERFFLKPPPPNLTAFFILPFLGFFSYCTKNSSMLTLRKWTNRILQFNMALIKGSNVPGRPEIATVPLMRPWWSFSALSALLFGSFCFLWKNGSWNQIDLQHWQQKRIFSYRCCYRCCSCRWVESICHWNVDPPPPWFNPFHGFRVRNPAGKTPRLTPRPKIYRHIPFKVGFGRLVSFLWWPLFRCLIFFCVRNFNMPATIISPGV